MARFDLTGKTALVTGAARGIGLETSRTLIARGANVVLLDLDEQTTHAAAAGLHDTRAIGLGGDVTSRTQLQQAVAAAVERFGRLDVVVANAGVASRSATMRAMNTEAADRTLDVNLMGVYRTVDVALPEIVRNRGHVVVIASIYAFINGAGAIPYAMSKAGVEQLGRALRLELAQHGASSTVAYFGLIDTAMVHQAIDGDDVAESMLQMLPKPLQKRLQPSAAAAGIVDGIERRRPRVILPKRWTALSVLRGLLNPLLDAHMERDAKTQAAIGQLDARAADEQPLTA